MADQSFLTDNEHFKAMVQVLSDQYQLLALPQATFDLVLPSLGTYYLGILEEELETTRHLLPDWDSDRHSIMYDRIERLATVPGALKSTIKRLLEQAPDEFGGGEDEEVNEEDFPEFQRDTDARLLKIVRRHVDTLSKQNVKWSASGCIDSIVQAGEELGSSTLFNYLKWTPNPIWGYHLDEKARFHRWVAFFKNTFGYLFAEHSKEVGLMLATKDWRLHRDVSAEVRNMIGEAYGEAPSKQG